MDSQRYFESEEVTVFVLSTYVEFNASVSNKTSNKLRDSCFSCFTLQLFFDLSVYSLFFDRIF